MVGKSPSVEIVEEGLYVNTDGYEVIVGNVAVQRYVNTTVRNRIVRNVWEVQSVNMVA